MPLMLHGLKQGRLPRAATAGMRPHPRVPAARPGKVGTCEAQVRLHVGLQLVAGNQDQHPHDLGQYLGEQQPPPGPLGHGQCLHAVACIGAAVTEALSS